MATLGKLDSETLERLELELELRELELTAVAPAIPEYLLCGNIKHVGAKCDGSQAMSGWNSCTISSSSRIENTSLHITQVTLASTSGGDPPDYCFTAGGSCTFHVACDLK